jgi:hypothetical protein
MYTFQLVALSGETTTTIICDGCCAPVGGRNDVMSTFMTCVPSGVTVMMSDGSDSQLFGVAALTKKFG